MLKTMLKLMRQEIELRQEVVSAIEALEENERLRRQIGSIEIQATTTTRKPRTKRKQTRTKKPSRAEKNKRNAKARAAYLEKHPKGRADDSMTHRESTTTSRLEALPTVAKEPGPQSRARTSQAVIDTLKRSPSPLTVEEIDTDLEKSGWPYKGKDRKGAIRATLSRLKINGTVSIVKRGTGLDAMKMFRLERTNGDTPSPVEQVLNGKEEEPFTREERAEVEDSEQQMLQDEARAEAAAEAEEF